MKKSLMKMCMIAVLAICTVSLTGCFTYLVSKAATVTIKVWDKGSAVQGKVVYMFDHSRSGWNNYVKENSSLQVVTDTYGEAEFKIREIDLSLDEDKDGTFTFVVYDGDKVAGTRTVYVKEGENKEAFLYIGEMD